MVNKVSGKPENPEEEDDHEPGERTKAIEPRMEPAEESCRIPLSENRPEKTVHLGNTLSPAEKEDLLKFLNDSKEVFAWSANDLQGVSRDLAQHSLNVDKMFKPKKQKIRKISDERADAAAAEVQRLLDAGVIRPVQYPEWLANVVMVKKKSGKWRMCIDFTDLNKACPKDPYPLPRIDKLIDIAAGCERMSLLDCFSGYHQIWMNPEDEEKTSFITPGGTFCFRRMPEGLRNAGSTFSRMSDEIFKEQKKSKNVVVYVDDIVVVSNKKETHIEDLKQTFVNLRKSGLRLNPEKCIFGIMQGKLLGCLVSARGIEANPEKIAAITNMRPPSSRKQVQRLTGRVAALSRFIARSAEKGLPFFRVLKEAHHFQWGPEQQKAFDSLKDYLTKLTTLVKPTHNAVLMLYLAASPVAVSAVLVEEKEYENRMRQFPIYFVSEALSGAKLNYSELEKIAYTVLMASRKLKHYFQAHKIKVISAQPLEALFKNSEAIGRVGKWAAELNEYFIDFEHRSAIKSQALADFIADWTPSADDTTLQFEEPTWIV
jgi:hypothetical protein